MAVTMNAMSVERPAVPTPNSKTTTSTMGSDDGAVKDTIPFPAAIDTSHGQYASEATESPIEFSGDVNTNNEIPNQEVLNKIKDINVLDKDGRALPFKNIYTGPNVPRRVLVIFIRHFFCGNCQEYLRTLTKSITPDSLLQLEVPTFIAVVGCGSPALIPMYQEETNCAFPIYADPTKALYDALGMLRTLNLGARPDYQRRGTLLGMMQSIGQGFKALKGGKAFQAGDMHQVGGEFLFEPKDMSTPICSPADELNKQLGESGGVAEEKRITWCHRMKNTRDHAEIPELREVLGLDGEGEPGMHRGRWMKAVRERKGTGLSARSTRSTTRSVEDGAVGGSGRASSEKMIA